MEFASHLCSADLKHGTVIECMRNCKAGLAMGPNINLTQTMHMHHKMAGPGLALALTPPCRKGMGLVRDQYDHVGSAHAELFAALDATSLSERVRKTQLFQGCWWCPCVPIFQLIICVQAALAQVMVHKFQAAVEAGVTMSKQASPIYNSHWQDVNRQLRLHGSAGALDLIFCCLGSILIICMHSAHFRSNYAGPSDPNKWCGSRKAR